MQQRLQQQLAELARQIAASVTLGRLALIVAGLFLMIYSALAFIYVSEGLSQQGMREELSRRQTSVARSAGRAQEVEAEYQRVQEAIPPADLAETDVFEKLLQIARESGVSPQISYRGETSKTIGGQVYRLLQFQVSAVGREEAVRDFFRKLDGEQTLLETLVVDTASLTTGGTAMTFNVYTLPR